MTQFRPDSRRRVLATKRRKNTAHSASCGWTGKNRRAPTGPKTRTLVRLQASPTMGQKSEAMQSQLQCSLDFACNSCKLKDLAYSRKISYLFSRFCTRRGGGGCRHVLNSKLRPRMGKDDSIRPQPTLCLFAKTLPPSVPLPAISGSILGQTSDR